MNQNESVENEDAILDDNGIDLDHENMKLEVGEEDLEISEELEMSNREEDLDEEIEFDSEGIDDEDLTSEIVDLDFGDDEIEIDDESSEIFLNSAGDGFEGDDEGDDEDDDEGEGLSLSLSKKTRRKILVAALMLWSLMKMILISQRMMNL